FPNRRFWHFIFNCSCKWCKKIECKTKNKKTINSFHYKRPFYLLTFFDYLLKKAYKKGFLFKNLQFYFSSFKVLSAMIAFGKPVYGIDCTMTAAIVSLLFPTFMLPLMCAFRVSLFPVAVKIAIVKSYLVLMSKPPLV